MLDMAQHDRIAGWAHDTAAPDKAVGLWIMVNGRLLERLLANRYREDLEQAGIGDGRKSFELLLATPLSTSEPQLIAVRRESDGAHLPGSPQLLPADTALVETVAPVEAVTEPPPSPSQIESETETESESDSESPLQGSLDEARRDLLSGWAHDPGAADAPVSLLISVNQQLLARVLANRYRADLEEAGIGDGRRSFEFRPVPPLSPLLTQVIELRRESDGAHLPGSPLVLEAEAAFSAEAQAWMSRVFAGADDAGGLADRVNYLAAELERLLQRRANATSRRAERQWLQSNPRWTGAPEPAAAADGRMPGAPRALVIDQQLPDLARDAGANAVVSQLRALQRLGFETSFAAAEMVTDAAAAAALEAMDVAVCRAPWHGSVEELLRREAHGYDLVLLHRLGMADRYIALVRHHQPKARLIYSVGDLQFLRAKRQAVVEKRPELETLSNRLQVAEMMSIARADSIITHSAYEASLLKRQAPSAKVYVVPAAITARSTQIPFEHRSGIALIGNFAQAADVDAARWLIDDILPLLHERDPTLQCLLVGSDLPASLRSPRPGLVVLGQVDRRSEVFDRVRLTIAPLNYGSGVRAEVLESMAAGVPCVCTPIAAEGLELPALWMQQVGEQPPQIVEAILRLHEDARLNRAVADAGLAYIRERTSEARIELLMRAVCGPSAHAR